MFARKWQDGAKEDRRIATTFDRIDETFFLEEDAFCTGAGWTRVSCFLFWLGTRSTSTHAGMLSLPQ